MGAPGRSARQNSILSKIREAGVVGAGGAGFPTEAKLSRQAGVVIANASECEPLLESDKHLILRECEKVLAGLGLAMEAAGASSGVVAVKKKHEDIIAILNEIIKGTDISVFPLENFYPAGDEHVLVYEITGRTVPMGGIPISAGAVVLNAATLAAVADACEGKPFTERYVTVAGEVKRPCVSVVPVGTSVREVIETAGGGMAGSGCVLIEGGPMTGKVITDPDTPVKKTTAAVIALPADCRTVTLKVSDPKTTVRRARSVCCQCSLCTDLCPRRQLGHKLFPHKSMRIFAGIDGYLNERDALSVSLCSECGLCAYYACPMELAPNRVNAVLKSALSDKGVKTDFNEWQPDETDVFREGRKVPSKRLLIRMGLAKYDAKLSFVGFPKAPDKVELILKQHIGRPAVPAVSVNDRVAAGAKVAGIPEGALSAAVHTPVAGRVASVTDAKIIVERS